MTCVGIARDCDPRRIVYVDLRTNTVGLLSLRQKRYLRFMYTIFRTLRGKSYTQGWRSTMLPQAKSEMFRRQTWYH
jgi:hypothetical protein